jgi:SAM-dependent methyltransferase
MAHDLNSLIASYKDILAPQSAEFLGRVFSKPLDTYRLRLEQYGFKGMRNILDAGCGFGQWTLAAAQINAHVDAVDVAPDRLIVLRDLATHLGVQNVAPRHASLEKLPYPDGRFDGVFCYGAVFLADWRRAVSEFARVLAPGGRLYICANGLGYLINLWANRPNATAANDPRMWAAKGLYQTWIYDRLGATTEPASLIVEPEAMLSCLEEAGFTDAIRADEGRYCAPGIAAPLTAPFFEGSYLGQVGVYEIVARRR